MARPTPIEKSLAHSEHATIPAITEIIQKLDQARKLAMDLVLEVLNGGEVSPQQLEIVKKLVDQMPKSEHPNTGQEVHLHFNVPRPLREVTSSSAPERADPSVIDAQVVPEPSDGKGPPSSA